MYCRVKHAYAFRGRFSQTTTEIIQIFFFLNRGVARVVHKYTHIQLTINLYKICNDGTMKHHPNNVTLTPHPAQTDNRETCSQGRGRAGEMRPYHQMGSHSLGRTVGLFIWSSVYSSSLGTLQQHVTQCTQQPHNYYTS